jgi:hypothetical protein
VSLKRTSKVFSRLSKARSSRKHNIKQGKYLKLFRKYVNAVIFLKRYGVKNLESQLKKRKIIYQYYKDEYVNIKNNITLDILKVITPHLKNFKNIKQNLNFIEVNGKNINLAISKYSQTILNIFDSMIDFFSKSNYNNTEFLFLNYMSTSGNYPMRNYFTDFELTRLTITQTGQIKIKSERQQRLIIGGFILIRVLVMNIIFKFYENEIKIQGDIGARYLTV